MRNRSAPKGINVPVTEGPPIPQPQEVPEDLALRSGKPVDANFVTAMDLPPFMQHVPQAAIQTSRDLKAEIAKSDALGLDRPAMASPVLHKDFEGILETIFVVDVKAEYDRLESVLHIGEQRGDQATIRKALDEAETNWRKAHKIFMAGTLEKTRFESDMELVTSAMWEESNRELQREKAAGQRNKTITDADTKAMCASKHPDEWRHLENRKAQVKAMCASFENLVEAWKSRCVSLRALLDSRK